MIIISVIVIIVFLLILGGVFFGIKSIGQILIFVLGAFFVLAIIGIIIYVIYYIWFKKHKFDATYMNRKNLVSAGRISKPHNINDLYLSGDAGHSRVRIGKITGYCRIQIIKKIVEYDEETGQIMYTQDKTDPNKKYEKFSMEQEEQDVFIVQNHGFIMSLFSDPLVIRVRPDDHNDLIGDVTLEGFSIIPISEYHYLNNRYMDVGEIDRSIKLEAFRTIYFEALKDTKEVVDKAVGLDAGHKKQIEQKQLYEMPNMGQPPQQR